MITSIASQIKLRVINKKFKHKSLKIRRKFICQKKIKKNRHHDKSRISLKGKAGYSILFVKDLEVNKRKLMKWFCQKKSPNATMILWQKVIFLKENSHKFQSKFQNLHHYHRKNLRKPLKRRKMSPNWANWQPLLLSREKVQQPAKAKWK
jgi:hypothetical protein